MVKNKNKVNLGVLEELTYQGFSAYQLFSLIQPNSP